VARLFVRPALRTRCSAHKHLPRTLEASLEQHATHPVLAPTHNPTLLARAPALSSDIAHLLATPESAWPTHPLARSIAQSPPPSLAAYTARIRTLAASPDPAPLLAHAYVRYLGDLSGGQVIRRRVSKAYHLDALTGLGTQFYEFQKLGGGGVAGVGDMRTIKVWYRDGMNKGVGDDKQRKTALVAEANTAFQLNGAIFDSLQAPTQHAIPEASVVPAGITDTKPAGGMVSIAGVLSFLLAMGIAHFALVTGGFMGDAGLEKWDRAREWVASAFGIPAA